MGHFEKKFIHVAVGALEATHTSYPLVPFFESIILV